MCSTGSVVTAARTPTSREALVGAAYETLKLAPRGSIARAVARQKLRATVLHATSRQGRPLQAGRFR